MSWTTAQKNYAKSEKGKLVRKKYQMSEKGKASRSQYLAKRKKKLQQKVNVDTNYPKTDKKVLEAETTNK